jgi:AcrR family transcriptional regulator
VHELRYPGGEEGAGGGSTLSAGGAGDQDGGGRRGVGSATVRRHFPTRSALLEAASRTRIDALCRRAHELAHEEDAREALLAWLADVVAYCVAAGGLAVALAYEPAEGDPGRGDDCSAALEQAGEPLLRRAAHDGTVSPGLTIADLVTLVVGIALATEHHRDPAAAADRVFRLSMAGIAHRPDGSPATTRPPTGTGRAGSARRGRRGRRSRRCVRPGPW